jgi:hypothetical protein
MARTNTIKEIIKWALAQGFYDIALRDLGLCLAALALWRLAMYF